ncbi:MAG: UDP-N-acetylglucosamine 1-carboxyvinyltransferase [Lentisphaerae bacterium ADurb.BinA184]|nr:MAG: UDP-N-acetylglucosamine 1-carboxyvinyltransferase [Lentisphaerae bacterium ADurb.BinA184]
MSVLRIQGGRPLTGTVAAAGNKNAVLPMIAAALLTDEPVTLDNVPDIGDVGHMLEIAAALGAGVERDLAARRVVLRGAGLRETVLPPRLCEELRAGVLFAAPLVARLGRAEMRPPGGDVIGRRRLDAHFLGLEALGVRCQAEERFTFHADRPLRGADIFLPEASVTGTEQILIAAAAAEGETWIRNCASEPHVQDLARLLAAMGAQIDGIGSNALHVVGARTLRGTTQRVSSDYTEAGSFLALAAATGGSITVSDVAPEHYRMVRHVFDRLGIRLELSGDRISVPAGQDRRIRPDARGGFPVIDDGPWPSFPSDLMSVAIVMATQLEGTVLFFEKMYESRMYFVDRLIAMGANAVICDPHRVVVTGPARLHGIQINSPDIRAGIALLGGALCARGQSTIRNVVLIDRGYEGIEGKLRALGADIVRENA